MVEFVFGFLLETLCSSQFCEFELNLDLIFCLNSCIMSFNLFMHHIVLLVLYFFVLTCSLPLVLFLFLFPICCVLMVLNSSTMPRKTGANRVPSTPSVSPSRVQLFRNEHFVILDEVDPAIKANLESRGWLFLLEIDHPPPTAFD